ncbi:hypothetical protein Hypma_005696 [Hypsizygus marmoreus]|uniref:Uncharacterized protein n=1 Tax=Hypsizygus marmoreus TaxID=39966 RepID=A0A369K1T6_HYPMA|nr:hypothetical protein Hypma_005696 [Hypsizygus marmoreus]
MGIQNDVLPLNKLPIPLPSQNLPESLPLPAEVRLAIKEGRRYTRIQFRRVQQILISFFQNDTHWAALRNWVLSLLQLPESTLGIDVYWSLTVLTSIHIFRILDSCDSVATKSKVMAGFRQVAQDHEKLIKSTDHNKTNGLPDIDDLGIGDSDAIYDAVFPDGDEEDFDEQVLASADDHQYPGTERDQRNEEEPAFLFLGNEYEDAPLVKTFIAYSRTLVTLFPGVQSKCFHTQKRSPTVDELKRVLGALPGGREKIRVPKDTTYRAGARSILGLVLQDMGKLEPGRYSESEWNQALESSELYNIMTQLLEPSYLTILSLNKDRDSEALARFMRIQGRFLKLLMDWTPSAAKESWVEKDVIFQPNPTITFDVTATSANEMVDYFIENPFLVTLAVAEVIYFPLNQETFMRSWRWLGQALQDTGCCVHSVGKSSKTLADFYSLFKKELLTKAKEAEIREMWEDKKAQGNVVAQIYLRTSSYYHLSSLQEEFLRFNRLNGLEDYLDIQRRLDLDSSLQVHDAQASKLN